MNSYLSTKALHGFFFFTLNTHISLFAQNLNSKDQFPENIFSSSSMIALITEYIKEINFIFLAYRTWKKETFFIFIIVSKEKN